jgi:uncharacterized membrane protein
MGSSNDAAVIVGFSLGPMVDFQNGYRFLWTAETGMAQLGSKAGRADAVSGDGSVVVGTHLSGLLSDSQGFRWTEATGFETIGPIGSWVNDISDDASTIIGTVKQNPSDAFPTAVIWTETEGMVQLGYLAFPGFPAYSIPHAVSGDGSLVGGESNNRAFLWDRTHGMRHASEALAQDYGVNTDGWFLESVLGISTDGRVIAGMGEVNNVPQAWFVVVPEPSTFVLMLLAASATATGCQRLGKRDRTTTFRNEP